MTAQAREGKVGANVSIVRGYGRGMEYNDLLRHASGFGLVGGPWTGAVALDIDGWPADDFSVALMGGQSNSPNMAGRYTIVFRQTALSRSSGLLRVRLIASSGTLTSPVYDAATGLTVVYLDFPAGGDQAVLQFANTSGGVRDLRVLRPGLDWRAADTPVFTATFLKHLEPFSTLRYMDWTSTNNFNYPARWATRPTLRSTRANVSIAAGSLPGTPWERAIELANESNTDMWINVPTRADGEYYTELAKLIKDKLKPNLKVYVEYSNEVWNGQFSQYHYMVGDTSPSNDPNNVGNAVLEEASNPNLRWDGISDGYTLGTRIYAERVFRISEAFRAVFGDTAMMTRVRPVLAWQVGTGSLFERMIAYARRVYPARSVNSYIYAIASAPYFGMGSQKNVEGLTVEDVITSLNANVLSLDTANSYENSAFIAKKFGLKWLAYEGGPDTFGPTSITAKADAHRDPRMKDLCLRNIGDFQKAGGDLFMFFTAGAGSWTTQYGAWPLEEYLQANRVSYKSQCVIKASSDGPPPVVLRHQVGTAFDAGELVNSYLAVGSPGYLNNRGWWALDQQRDYVVSAPATACYKLTVTSSFVSTGAPPKFDVLINNAPQFTAIPMVQTSTGGTYVPTVLGNVCLEAGGNVLSLKMSTAANGTTDRILLEPVTTP